MNEPEPSDPHCPRHSGRNLRHGPGQAREASGLHDVVSICLKTRYRDESEAKNKRQLSVRKNRFSFDPTYSLLPLLPDGPSPPACHPSGREFHLPSCSQHDPSSPRDRLAKWHEEARSRLLAEFVECRPMQYDRGFARGIFLAHAQTQGEVDRPRDSISEVEDESYLGTVELSDLPPDDVGVNSHIRVGKVENHELDFKRSALPSPVVGISEMVPDGDSNRNHSESNGNHCWEVNKIGHVPPMKQRRR